MTDTPAKIDSAKPLATLQEAGTRRDFVERLAKTTALPIILPLVLSRSRSAVADH